MTITVQRIAAAIERATAAMPEVRVVVTPRCDDRNWVVDACCARIYVSSGLRPAEFVLALNSAIDALVRDKWRRERASLIRLSDRQCIPAQRGSDGHAADVSLELDPVWIEQSARQREGSH